MDCSSQTSLSFPISQSLLKPMSIDDGVPSNHLILGCFLLLLPSIFPKVLFSELALRIRWLKYWSFSFNISPSNEYSGLISFRIDWFDLLAVQGILKSLLQHHRLKVSNLWCLAFFMVQLTFVHDYWTNQSFDSMSAKLCLCFLICCIDLSYFSSKEQVSFNFMAVVTICSDGHHVEPKKIKSVTVSIFFPIYLPYRC